MHISTFMHGSPNAVESRPHPAAQDDLDHLVVDPPAELCNDDRRSNDSPSDEEGDLDAPGYGFGV
jgi:hypothetical protein